jgi:tetratricopeptide (TPR) repeat protein
LKQVEKWQQAIFAFDRALDCDPFNTAPLLNSTEALLRLGQSGQALVRLKRAVEIAPDKFEIWTNLAAVHVKHNDKRNALDCLGKARALAPERYHKEIDRSVQAAEALSDEPSALALLASSPSLARERLKDETRRNPRDKNAWHNLGLSHIHVGEHADARECFARVLSLDARDSYAICRLIELSAALKDIGAVEHWCSVMAQMPKGETAAIAFRARALAQCDRYNDARKLILDAVRRYPDEPDILIACGDVMMTYPDSSTAMSNASIAYNRAVEILKHGIDIARCATSKVG